MGDNKLLFYNFDAALVALLADHAMMTHQLKFFTIKLKISFIQFIMMEIQNFNF